jgi:hypothetical protein
MKFGKTPEMKEGSLMCCNPWKVSDDGDDYHYDDKSVAQLIAGYTTMH